MSLSEEYHIFSLTDKDMVRIEEQQYESELRQRLQSLGLSVDFDNISPHGFTKKKWSKK